MVNIDSGESVGLAPPIAITSPTKMPVATSHPIAHHHRDNGRSNREVRAAWLVSERRVGVLNPLTRP
jgi:hypothetical protein